MIQCHRPEAPPLLTEHGDAVGRDYAERRARDPSARFDWPVRGGRSLRDVVREALLPMTLGRCSYCDAYPLGASGKKELDHFRPKSRPEFYGLVCAWTNLFLACTACNGAKREQWDEALLRPDAEEFRFDRYFYYEPSTGRLIPTPGATPEDRHRATRTIDILDLNSGDRCLARRVAAQSIRRASTEELADVGYRYLIALVRD